MAASLGGDAGYLFSVRGGLEFMGMSTAVAKYPSSGVRVALVAMRSANSDGWKGGGNLLRQHMRQPAFVGCGSGSRFEHGSSRPVGDRALGPIARLLGRTLRHGPIEFWTQRRRHDDVPRRP